MANRFARKIKEGGIASIGELKAEFKELAKKTHPDALGPGADHGDFAALRGEFEAALRDFEKHRFGLVHRAGRGVGAGDRARAQAGAPSGLAGEALSDDAWACLAVLLGRGFPKAPRHEKEKLRYEYASWRLCEALGPERRALFDDCEAELLLMRAARQAALKQVLGFFRLLIDYRSRGLSAMRTEIVLALARLRSDPRVGPGCREFALALALDLGVGAEIGSD